MLSQANIQGFDANLRYTTVYSCASFGPDFMTQAVLCDAVALPACQALELLTGRISKADHQHQ